jgi:negative regulator of flagellin synthesis FlgM
MKINRVPSSKIISQYIHVKGNATTQSSSAQKSDKVELTDKSQTFSAALKEAKKAFGTRSTEELNRIQEVKQQVSDGTYNVSGEDVAAKMLGLDE